MGHGDREDRPASRPLFLLQAAWILDRVGARHRHRWQRCRHGRQFPDLATDRRQGPCHRRRNANRTSLYNIRENDRDDLLALFDVPRTGLPVKDCAAEYGICVESLFDAALPIRGVAGDQQAAAIGKVLHAGRGKIRLWHQLLRHHQYR